MKYTKHIEFFGMIFGIIGAFVCANGMMEIGYPIFAASSVCLLTSAWFQKNKNLMMLQFVFLCANINGIYTFMVK